MPRSKSSTFDLHYPVDLAIRVLLAPAFCFAAAMYFSNAMGHLKKFNLHHVDANLLAGGLSILAIAVYTAMIACLYILRLRPVNKFAGWWPAIASLLGGFLMEGLLLLDPRTDLPVSIQILASLLILTGNGFAVYALTRLGRSFSILPESRKLVTSGPYKIVRHPLYAAEAVATLGAVITFLSPVAVALYVAQLALQLVRMHYEETVLRKSFPAYKAYAKHTARLIPGVY